ncbi:MAG: YgiT-type zinc finger protein [Elusimicrobiota bacterium]
MQNKYPDCVYCGGKVVEKKIEFDYRRSGKHFIIKSIPAGVCHQCGEKFFRSDVSKKMDELYHRRQQVEKYIKIPVLEFAVAK